MTGLQKVAQVLADARDTLRQVTAERDAAVGRASDAETKLAHVAQRLEVEKTAAIMVDKGLRADIDELIPELMKEAEAGRLPVIQEAVKMAAPVSGSFHINHDEARGGSDASDLERYLVGEVG